MAYLKECGCGCIKKLYQSEREAEEQRDYALLTRHVTLAIYECPVSSGWHLTSKSIESFFN